MDKKQLKLIDSCVYADSLDAPREIFENGRNLLISNMPSTSKQQVSSFHYAKPLIPCNVYSTNILFMGTVAMVFAPLAPLVVLAGALVFWMSSWVYKYQLMFVFTSKVESGGVSSSLWIVYIYIV
jgi:hypothetical protein